VSESWATFAFEAANFLLLAALLGWLFFRPVRAAIERRRSQIEGEQRTAAAAREQAEHERAQALAQRREQESQLDALRERLSRELEAEKERTLADARAEMQQERKRLEQELLAQRREQVRTGARDAARAAREVVRQLLAEIRGPELEEMLAGAACRELERLRERGALAPIVIESVEPLAPESRARVLSAAGAPNGAASERLNPELIAGLRVHTARGLVDATAAGASAQAERLLVSRLEETTAGHD